MKILKRRIFLNKLNNKKQCAIIFEIFFMQKKSMWMFCRLTLCDATKLPIQITRSQTMGLTDWSINHFSIKSLEV